GLLHFPKSARFSSSESAGLCTRCAALNCIRRTTVTNGKGRGIRDQGQRSALRNLVPSESAPWSLYLCPWPPKNVEPRGFPRGSRSRNEEGFCEAQSKV